MLLFPYNIFIELGERLMEVREHIKYTFIAIDGKEFDEEVECLKHELVLVSKDSMKSTQEYNNKLTDMLKHIKQLECKLRTVGVSFNTYNFSKE